MIPCPRLGRERSGIAWLPGRALLVLAISLWASIPAWAQEVPRAFRGLFAVADDPANPRHRFDLGASLFAGVVHADVEGAATLEDEQLLTASYQGLSAVAVYAFNGRLISFESLSGATFQHYSALPGFRTTRYYERLQFVARIKPRTSIRLRGGALYSPFYSFAVGVDPEAEEGEIAAGQEPVVSVRENVRLDAQIELTHRSSPRSEVSVDYGIADTRFLNEDFDLATHRAGVRYRRTLTEHAGVQLGYVFHQWRYAGVQAPTLRGHDVRAGISYNRWLPASPRTRFGFDFGSLTARQPGTTRFDLTGAAFLARQLSPNWLTAATYSRGFDVRAGFAEPLYYFYSTAALSLAGTVARRAAVRAVGSYVRGSFSAGDLDNRARAWTGTAGVSFGLARVLSVQADGAVSSLRLGSRLGPVTGLPTFVDGFSFVTGMTVRFPVLR